jgi:hypothetical protein
MESKNLKTRIGRSKKASTSTRVTARGVADCDAGIFDFRFRPQIGCRAQTRIGIST